MYVRGTVTNYNEYYHVEIVGDGFTSRMTVAPTIDISAFLGQEITLELELTEVPYYMVFPEKTRVVRDPSGLRASTFPRRDASNHNTGRAGVRRGATLSCRRTMTRVVRKERGNANRVACCRHGPPTIASRALIPPRHSTARSRWAARTPKPVSRFGPTVGGSASVSHGHRLRRSRRRNRSVTTAVAPVSATAAARSHRQAVATRACTPARVQAETMARRIAAHTASTE